jgi:ABC-type Zn uptake system ZnuABC Zn-binding protein ZnuA
MWLDPVRAEKYVGNIRDGLAKADPANAALYEKNAAAYLDQLQELDAWIKEQVSLVPAERRLLVTNHESMGYFAEHYGFTVVAQVIPSTSTEAGSSAQQLAQAIDKIKAAHAPAVFLGELENPDLADQIAAETGVKVVGDLYLESLSKGPPAATYIDLMKHNVQRIVEALR